MIDQHCGDSIVLRFAGVDPSGGVVSTHSVEVLCKCYADLHLPWLLDTPAKGLMVQSDYKVIFS